MVLPLQFSLSCSRPLSQSYQNHVALSSKNAHPKRNENEQGPRLHPGQVHRRRGLQCLHARGQVKSARTCQEYQPVNGARCCCCSLCVSPISIYEEDRSDMGRPIRFEALADQWPRTPAQIFHWHVNRPRSVCQSPNATLTCRSHCYELLLCVEVLIIFM